ncbi:hypothetical protein [uncultured Nonlabens sp.]|uniref:hypothetical protein n=1 Tax=uncultured Nonlabens sp. TaxID=859306 RepID=UPI002603C7F9|nr:hypothetical protein [uncultured Nonlabens sp.]
MKNYLRILLGVLSLSFVNAQVGINVQYPDQSAILDISSEDKGILFPRMDLKNLSESEPVNNPATGLVVWNTDASNNGADSGFYYWNNSWTKLGGNEFNGPGTVDTKAYGQLTINSDWNTNLQQYTFTSVNTNSSGIATSNVRVNDGNNFSLRPEVAGLYRVTFTITYRKNTAGGAGDIEFYLFKNNNAINDAKVRAPLKETVNTVSFSKLLNLEAFQYYGLGISKSDMAPQNLSITILKNQTSFNIEKID